MLETETHQLIDTREKHPELNNTSLRKLFVQAPAVIAILKGPDFVFEFANPAYIALIGGRNPIGKSLLEALPEIAGQGFIELLNNVYKTGETFTGKEMPVKVEKSDGELKQFYLNFTYQSFTNDNNDIEGILVFAYDVTEQVEARKRVEANEKRFSNILSQSIMAIGILKGTDMVIESANEPLLKIWGRGPEIVGKPLFEAMPELKSQEFPKQLNDVFTTGIPYTVNENRALVLNNGITVERFFSIVIQPYSHTEGMITGVTVIGTEITEQVLAKKQIEQKEAEQKKLLSHLKLATDSAKIGIWSLDIESSKLDWSSTHKTMWGYVEHFENLTYADWHKAIVPEDKELAFQKIEESKISHGVYDVDYRICRANDGAIVWIKSTGQYQYDEFGVAHTLTGISIDITQQKTFSEELEKKVNERTEELAYKSTQLKETIQTLALKNIELENSNAELKSFTYIASHDLQEPLRKMQLFSRLIKDTENFSEKTQDYFNRIIAAGEHMQNLIISLLDFSRADTAKLVIVPCNMNTIVEESKNEMSLPIIEKNAIIDYQHLPTINGSHLQLCQLFTNLIGNAIKYSRPEIAPHITITAERVEGKEINHASANKQTEYHVIKFSDNGIGFENEYATKIFELFQRLHGRNKYSGTGIGLSIVKKIVTNHNGFIIAEGRPGIGSTFTIYLPIL